jgi:hypothetical protein
MRSKSRRCQNYASSSLLTTLALFATLAMTVASHAQQLITFDAPNSGTNQYIGTEASGINLWGTIIGDVTDNDGGTHGFVRSPKGQFTEFDVPGANPAPGYNCLYGAGGTCPGTINDFGLIAGSDGDANGVWHGFVRAPDGKIAVFDVPGASTSSGLGTFVQSVNNFGVIAGYYYDSNNLGHGFLRSPDGRIATFEDTAAGTGAFQGTYPESINDLGMTSGLETDSNNFSHGFVRDSAGKITTFDPPGSLESSYGLDNGYINDFGVVAGCYYQGSGNVSYGFQRAPDGDITVYQVPDAGAEAYEGTFIGAVNIEGTTTGYVTDQNVENHSFVRYANGKAIVFDVPGQLLQVGSDFGSAGEAINAVGVVAGRWHDTNYLLHGFVRLPD